MHVSLYLLICRRSIFQIKNTSADVYEVVHARLLIRNEAP